MAPSDPKKNLQFGFFVATLLPYVVSLFAIFKGQKAGEGTKTYWYALGFLSYLIATIAGQIIAATTLKKKIKDNTASELDKSNYQYTSFSAIGTGLLIALVLTYVVKFSRR